MAVAKFLTARRVLILLLSVPLLITAITLIRNQRATTVQANGDLFVDFGVPHGAPIFNFDDFKPGDCTEHTVTATNDYSTDKLIFLKAKKTKDEGTMSEVLSFEVSEGATSLYGGSPEKSLKDFFSEHSGIPLTTLSTHGGHTDYTIKICFDIQAGNEYQTKTTMFDLDFFASYSEPEEPLEDCSEIETTNTIYGTNGRNIIWGTNQNDLIITYGGKDVVFGSDGDDCIIAGDDKDIIFGGKGNDLIYGGSDKDRLAGDDGQDRIFGGSSDDILYGGMGDDYLDAGAGRLDIIDGEFGTDTCINATRKINCEI